MDDKEELSEWYFSNNPKILSKDKNVKELKEELYRKKECYEKTLEAKENELKLKIHKNRVLYENKIKKLQQIIEKL
jgi:endonuclease III